MKTRLLIVVIFSVFLSFILAGCPAYAKKSKWVGTWGTSPQLTETHNNPPDPGLANNSIRQIVRVSIGGEEIRLHFSNEFSKNPIFMNGVYIAVSTGGSSIDISTSKELTFNGEKKCTIEAGAAVSSDPIEFKLNPRSDVAITINFGETSSDITGHPGSRTTSYIREGNQAFDSDFSSAVKTDHWYIIKGIDVRASKKAGTVAVLGNSITDGRGSGTNKQNRWPDILSENLLKNRATQNVGVLNMGVGGNCVLKNCLGPAAKDRYDRDVINRSGVKWVIIFEAVNDLGSAPDSITAMKVVDDLIVEYNIMIDKAHTRNIKAFGATITPFGQSFYFTSFREAARQKLNSWIRTGGNFDAVIDFDKTVRNHEDTISILPELHTGDFLHLNEAGYKKMGESVDINLFQ